MTYGKPRAKTANGLVLPDGLGDEQDDINNWTLLDKMLSGTNPDGVNLSKLLLDGDEPFADLDAVEAAYPGASNPRGTSFVGASWSAAKPADVISGVWTERGAGGGSTAPVPVTVDAALTPADAGKTFVNNTGAAKTLTLVAGLGTITLVHGAQPLVAAAGAVTLTGDTTTSRVNSRIVITEVSPGVYAGVGPHFQIWGAPRKPYLGPVTDSQMPTWGTSGGSTKYISARIYQDLYEDIDHCIVVFTTQYGQAETASAGTADIQLSIDGVGGVRKQVTWDNGNNTGVIPPTGLYFSDPVDLGGTLRRGSKLWLNEYVTYNNTGVNGHHRNNRGVLWPQCGEISESPLGAGSAPVNRVMSGVPTAGGTQFILRPVLILGYTTRDTFLLTGDSIGANDYSFPFIDGGRLDTGIPRVGLHGRFAAVNVAQASDSYGAMFATPARYTLRTQIGQYCSVVLDEYGRNDSTSLVSVATFMGYLSQFRAKFPDAAYGHTTLPPKTSVPNGNYWTTTADQTRVNALEPDYNDAIRQHMSNDFYVDVAVALESYKGSGLWLPGSTTITGIAVTSINSGARLLTGVAGNFRRDMIGTHLIVKPATPAASGQPGFVYAVAADGSTASVICATNGITVGTGLEVITDAMTFDGTHPTRQGELRAKTHGDWSALDKFF